MMRWMLPFLISLSIVLPGCVTPDPEIQRLVQGIEGPGLLGHVQALTAIGPRPVTDADATRRTLEYLRGELESYGYETTDERFEHHGIAGWNLLAELRGETDARSVVEIGAHYDTVPGSPGADDNGSGVAGVLEVARVLAGTRVERTVRFCFFGAEEVGLVGSTFHVESLDEPDDLEGILVLEMIGFATDEPDSQDAPVRIPLIASMPRQGNFIAVVGNFSSGGIGNRFERSIRRYAPDLEYFSANRIGGFFADAARSDHSPYWRAGLRGVMVTDTANFRTPHYHQPTDVPETLNVEFMTGVTRAAAATMLDWAGYRGPAGTSE